jgi:hypothetical protein
MAWTYTIKSNRVDGATLWSNVSYTNGVNTEVVDVPNFEPKDEATCLTGIKNRGKSIERAYAAAATNGVIKVELDKEINKPTPVGVAVGP